MRVIDLKALARECGLRGYSKLRNTELISLLRSNDVSTRTSTGTTTNMSKGTATTHTRPAKPTRLPPPPLQMSTWEPVDDKLRPSLQKMDIFECLEMAKCRP